MLALTQSDQSRRPYPLRAYCAQAGTGTRGSHFVLLLMGPGHCLLHGTEQAEVQRGPGARREQTDLSHSGQLRSSAGPGQ